jgi:hypothetical protein
VAASVTRPGAVPIPATVREPVAANVTGADGAAPPALNSADTPAVLAAEAVVHWMSWADVSPVIRYAPAVLNEEGRVGLTSSVPTVMVRAVAELTANPAMIRSPAVPAVSAPVVFGEAAVVELAVFSSADARSIPDHSETIIIRVPAVEVVAVTVVGAPAGADRYQISSREDAASPTARTHVPPPLSVTEDTVIVVDWMAA